MNNQYPEHERLAALQGQNETIGEFIEWLGGKGYEICQRHHHSKGCYDGDFLLCGYQKEEFQPTQKSVETWIAEYFKIDKKKFEQEKSQMLGVLREMTTAPAPAAGERGRE